jgi:hypothetical protein
MGVKFGPSHQGKNTDCVKEQVLKRIFVPNRDRVTRGSRKLHNEELHNCYASPKKIKSRRVRDYVCWAACSVETSSTTGPNR